MPVANLQTWTSHMHRKDLALSLGVHVSTLDRWRKRLRFPRPAFRLGRTPFWTVEALRRWEERQSRKRAARPVSA